MGILCMYARCAANRPALPDYLPRLDPCFYAASEDQPYRIGLFAHIARGTTTAAAAATPVCSSPSQILLILDTTFTTPRGCAERKHRRAGGLIVDFGKEVLYSTVTGLVDLTVSVRYGLLNLFFIIGACILPATWLWSGIFPLRISRFDNSASGLVGLRV